MATAQPSDTADAVRAPFIILYCSESHTYACEEGDSQPTYADLAPLREETIQSMHKHHHDADVIGDSRRVTGLSTTAAATAEPVKSCTSSGSSSTAKGLANALRQLLCDRDVVLVLALAASAYWADLLTCLTVVCGPRSLFVVSDVVATTLACGQVEEGVPCVVVQVSWNDVTLSMVTEGFSRRYSTSRDASLRGVVATAPHAAATPVGESDPLLSWARTSSSAPLRDPTCRAQLIRAFGFRNYMRVLRAHEVREQRDTLRQRATAGGGKGKGQQASRAATSARLAPDGSRGEWTRKYDQAARREPGVFARRLVRVLKAPPSANTLYPVLITGEALQVPFYSDLVRCAVLRCGPPTWRAVSRDLQQKEREREARRAAKAKVSPLHKVGGTVAQHRSAAVAASRKRQRAADEDEDESATTSEERSTSGSDEEEEDEDEASSSDRSSASSSSSHTSSDSEDEFDPTADEGEWLALQSTPIEPPPPWLPLVGGSVVARILPTFDASKMCMTPEEIESTKGQIVFWKAIL